MKIKPFDKPNKIITVLEIGKNWLKVVQVEHLKGKKRICHLNALEISSFSEKELVAQIAQWARQLKIDSENLMVSVPHATAITKGLSLPSTRPAEIEDMVELQAAKQTPYSTDEIIKGYYLVGGSRQEGYSRVLLVVVHRDIIQRYLRVTEKAGLYVERVGFSTEGLLGWGSFACSEVVAADKAGVLIEIDHNAIDFEVVANGNVIFSRGFSLGSSDFSLSAREWQNKFLEEVTRSLYAYQNEVTGKEVGKVIISATKFAKQRLDKNFIQEEIDLPVEIVGQLEGAESIPQVLESYNQLSEKNLSFASLIGGAIIFGKQLIDLVPQEVKMERSLKEKGQDIYHIGILAVFILLILSGLFLGRLYNQERYLEQLEARLTEIGEQARILGKKDHKISLTRDRINLRNFSLALVYGIHDAISPETHLESITFDGEERLMLRGSSESMAEVFKFVNELEALDYFENVETRHTEKRSREGKDIINFEILSPLAQKYKNIEDHKL